MINTTPHIHSKVTDYTLGLLKPDESKLVERHTAVCDSCQAELNDELHLAQLVQTTLQTASHVENGRLQKLMPAIPQKRTQKWFMQLPAQRQLASLCVLALLIFSGMGFYQANFNGGYGTTPPTSLAITATNTVLPTETAVATESATNNEPTSTAVAGQTNPTEPTAPQPAATPIAYVMSGE